MEIIEYIATDWFTHYLFVPTNGMPFLLWLFMVSAVIIAIYLIFKKIIW